MYLAIRKHLVIHARRPFQNKLREKRNYALFTSINLSGTSCGSTIPRTFSHTSPGVVVVSISPSEVVLGVPGVVLAGVVGTE